MFISSCLLILSVFVVRVTCFILFLCTLSAWDWFLVGHDTIASAVDQQSRSWPQFLVKIALELPWFHSRNRSLFQIFTNCKANSAIFATQINSTQPSNQSSLALCHCHHLCCVICFSGDGKRCPRVRFGAVRSPFSARQAPFTHQGPQEQEASILQATSRRQQRFRGQQASTRWHVLQKAHSHPNMHNNLRHNNKRP